jgi:putative acetyltransferase
VSELTIRLWRPEDTHDLLTLFRRSIREIASNDYTLRQTEVWSEGPDDFAERMRLRVTFVAEDNGRLAGFIQYEPPDHIDMAYVHPDHQRKGIATALVTALETEARRRGAAALHVEVSITARRFFEVQGYETITAQTVQVRGERFLNYRMAKRLN